MKVFFTIVEGLVTEIFCDDPNAEIDYIDYDHDDFSRDGEDDTDPEIAQDIADRKKRYETAVKTLYQIEG